MQRIPIRRGVCCAIVLLVLRGGIAGWVTPAPMAPTAAIERSSVLGASDHARPHDIFAPDVEVDYPELATVETVRRVCRVTAYCDRGLTAAGIESGVGQCAAPQDVPLGSKVYIPALNRTFVVTDRTARRFRHNTVDIFIPARDACLEFGCRYVECEFYVVAAPPPYGTLRLAMSQITRQVWE